MAGYPTGAERCNILLSALSKLVCLLSLVLASVGVSLHPPSEHIFMACVLGARKPPGRTPPPSYTPLTIY